MKIRLGELRRLIKRIIVESTDVFGFRELMKKNRVKDESVFFPDANADKTYPKLTMIFADERREERKGRSLTPNKLAEKEGLELVQTLPYARLARFVNNTKKYLSDEEMTGFSGIYRKKGSDKLYCIITAGGFPHAAVWGSATRMLNFQDKEVPPEGDSEVFQRFVFGDRRKDVPPESDTEEENAIYQKIWSRIMTSSNDSGALTVSDVGLINREIEKGNYKEIFQPPAEMLYRGLSLSEDVLKKILGTDEDLPPKGEKTGQFALDPQDGSKDSGSSSWTHSKGTATYIAEDAEDASNEFVVVITARSSDNPDRFLKITQKLYDIIYSNYANEKETIGVGSIVCSKIEWKKTK